MKTPLERRFIFLGRIGRAMYAQNGFALVPVSYSRSVAVIEHAKSMIFCIVDTATGREAGELALRIGESSCMFYLGHIGYHIDPPYRGRGGAYHACRMAIPLLQDMGLRTLVITTDDDNLPSIRTCEKLGCVLESTVDVPPAIQREYEISSRKRRYIWTLDGE